MINHYLLVSKLYLDGTRKCHMVYCSYPLKDQLLWNAYWKYTRLIRRLDLPPINHHRLHWRLDCDEIWSQDRGVDRIGHHHYWGRPQRCRPERGTVHWGSSTIGYRRCDHKGWRSRPVARDCASPTPGNHRRMLLCGLSRSQRGLFTHGIGILLLRILH